MEDIATADGVNSESAKAEIAKVENEELLSDVSSMEIVETDGFNGDVIEDDGENEYIVEDALSDVSISEILDGDLIIDEAYSDDDQVCDELVKDSQPITVPDDVLSDISSACSVSVSEGRRNSSRSKSSKTSSTVDAVKTKTDKSSDKPRKVESSRRRRESDNTSVSKSSSEKSELSSHRSSRKLPEGIIPLKNRRDEYRCTVCYCSLISRRNMERHLYNRQHLKRAQHIAAMDEPHLSSSSREKRKHEDRKESHKDTSKAKTKATESSDAKRPKLGSKTESKDSQKTKAATSTETKQKDSTSDVKMPTAGSKTENKDSQKTKSATSTETKQKDTTSDVKKPTAGKRQESLESKKSSSTTEIKVKVVLPDAKKPRLGMTKESKDIPKTTTGEDKEKKASADAKTLVSEKAHESEAQKVTTAKEKDTPTDVENLILGKGQEGKEVSKAPTVDDKKQKEASQEATGKGLENREATKTTIVDEKKQMETCADTKKPLSGKAEEGKEAERDKIADSRKQKEVSAICKQKEDAKQPVSEKQQESKEEKAKPVENKKQNEISSDTKKLVPEKGQESKEAEKAKPVEVKRQKESSLETKKAVSEKSQETKGAEETKAVEDTTPKESPSDIKKPLSDTQKSDKVIKKSSASSETKPKESSSDAKKPRSGRHKDHKESQKDKDRKESQKEKDHKDSQRDKERKESQRDKDRKDSQRDRDRKESQRDRDHKELQKDKEGKDTSKVKDGLSSTKKPDAEKKQDDKDSKSKESSSASEKKPVVGKRKDRELQKDDTASDTRAGTKRPRLETETDKEPKKTESRADPRVLRNLSDMKQPILGVEEISLTGSDGSWTYHCRLCSVACGSIDIRHHLRGKRHRLSYTLRREREGLSHKPIHVPPANKGDENRFAKPIPTVKSNREKVHVARVFHQLGNEEMHVKPPRPIEDRNFRNEPPITSDRSDDWKQAHWNDCCNSFLKITMDKPDIPSRHELERLMERSHKKFIHNHFSQELKSSMQRSHSPDDPRFDLQYPPNFQHSEHLAQPHFLHPQHPANTPHFQEHTRAPPFHEHGHPPDFQEPGFPPHFQEPGQQPHFQEHGPPPQFQQPDFPVPPHFRQPEFLVPPQLRQPEFPVPQQFLRPGFFGPPHFQRPGFQVPPQFQRPGFPVPQQFRHPEFPQAERPKNAAQQLSPDDKSVSPKPNKVPTADHKPMLDVTIPSTDKSEAALDIINSMIQNYLKNELQKLPSQLQKILSESTRNEDSNRSTHNLSDVDAVEDKLSNARCSSKSGSNLPTDNDNSHMSEHNLSSSANQQRSDEEKKIRNCPKRVSTDDIASSFDQHSYRNIENVESIPFLGKISDSPDSPNNESKIDSIQSFDQLSGNQRKDADPISSANKDESTDNREHVSATSTTKNCFEQFISSWIEHTGAVPTRATETEPSDKLSHLNETTKDSNLPRDDATGTSNQVSPNLSNVDHAELGRQVAAFLSKYSLNWSENIGNLLLGRNPESFTVSPADASQYTRDHGAGSINRDANPLDTREHVVDDMNMGSISVNAAPFARNNSTNSMNRGINRLDAPPYISVDGRSANPIDAAQYNINRDRIRDENLYRRDPDNWDGTLRNRVNDSSKQLPSHWMGSSRDVIPQRSHVDGMVDNYHDRSEMSRANIDRERNSSTDDIRERQGNTSNYSRRGRGVLPFRSAHKLSFLDLLNQHRNDPIFNPGFSRSATSRRQNY